MQPTDQLQRPLEELRVSLTDRCNLRCRYCMPAEIFGANYPYLPRSEILSFEEITRIVQVFVELGVRKVRLTGGEPLLRRDLTLLIAKLAELRDLPDLALTTNGLLLTKHAASLAKAGLRRINLSLDSLEPETFRHISGGRGDLNAVLEGLEAARQAGLRPKVNAVIQRGINETDILPLARYCRERQLELRFIEYMDVGNSNGWRAEQVVTEAEILEILSKEFDFQPQAQPIRALVARSWNYRDLDLSFGIIASVSRPFCSGCGRIRLSADGQLFNCLFATTGPSIRDVLRAGVSDVELSDWIRQHWHKRRDRYSELRAEGKPERDRIEMSYIGG